MARIHDQAEVQAHNARSKVSPEAAARPSILSWARLKPLAGLAVAASVAMVTIALWQPLKQESGQPGDSVATVDQQKIQQFVGATGSGWCGAGIYPGTNSRHALEGRARIARDATKAECLPGKSHRTIEFDAGINPAGAGRWF